MQNGQRPTELVARDRCWRRHWPRVFKIWRVIRSPAGVGANHLAEGDIPMKVMVIVKASKALEASEMPSKELLTAMGNYNEELVKAGSDASQRCCLPAEIFGLGRTERNLMRT